MHYPRGTWDGDCQLIPKKKVSCVIKNTHIDDIGLYIGLSSKDVAAINQRYGCEGYLKIYNKQLYQQLLIFFGKLFVFLFITKH